MNAKTFPNLGAFPGEVGSGNSPGGIGGSWPQNLPLNYWWNYGKKSKKKSKKKIKKTRKTKKMRSKQKRN